jgi:hypothetical protein
VDEACSNCAEEFFSRRRLPAGAPSTGIGASVKFLIARSGCQMMVTWRPRPPARSRIADHGSYSLNSGRSLCTVQLEMEIMEGSGTVELELTASKAPLFDLVGTRVFVAGHKGMVGSALLRRLAS